MSYAVQYLSIRLFCIQYNSILLQFKCVRVSIIKRTKDLTNSIFPIMFYCSIFSLYIFLIKDPLFLGERIGLYYSVLYMCLTRNTFPVRLSIGKYNSSTSRRLYAVSGCIDVIWHTWYTYELRIFIKKKKKCNVNKKKNLITLYHQYNFCRKLYFFKGNIS